MFEMEATLNQFLVASLQKVMADIPADRITERPPGNGHPPLWILGHLAMCVDFGNQLLGSPPQRPEWLPVFGPGSSDDVAQAEQYDADELQQMIVDGYPRLAAAAGQGDQAALAQPHGLALLEGSAITTRGQLLAHLLTTHFSFHLAQLSTWRRAAGHPALF